MGVHTFYTNFIKKHPEIVKPRSECGVYDNLYMDCNSIIYDVFHRIQKMYDDGELSMETIDSMGGIENLVIEEVKKEISKHIKIIAPTKYVFIAFDGEAAKAKKKQQMKRRARKLFLEKIDGKTPLWNTNEITAGRPFMNKLSESIYEHFKAEDFGLEQMDISCSDEPGEGEHKFLIQEGRDIIYGLDSDLLLMWHIDLYRKEDEVICVTELDRPVNKKYILLGNDYIPGIASFQELDPIDVYVEKVEDFVEIFKQLQMRRTKSELDVKRPKNLPKVKDCSDYIGTSRMRYYKAMCNTTDVEDVCRNYWEGLKYSLDVYTYKKSCNDEWCYEYGSVILLCDVLLLFLGVGVGVGVGGLGLVLRELLLLLCEELNLAYKVRL